MADRPAAGEGVAAVGEEAGLVGQGVGGQDLGADAGLGEATLRTTSSPEGLMAEGQANVACEVVMGDIELAVELGRIGAELGVEADWHAVVAADRAARELAPGAGNAAIMGASHLVPGESVEGSATIENVGDAAGDFTLTATDVTSTPGPKGGSLVARLRLSAYDDATGTSLYSGQIDELNLSLGTWAPGESRTYRFAVAFPEGTDADDNRFQLSTITATPIAPASTEPLLRSPV